MSSPWKPSKRTYGIMIERTAHHNTVDIWHQAWMYGQSVTGKPYFHQPSHNSCFLILELYFNRNRTDDRSFHSIQGYGALRKLHRWALRFRWVQTHTDACCCFSCIACLFYIYQICIFCNSHEIHFGTTKNSILRKRALVNKIMMRLVKLCM